MGDLFHTMNIGSQGLFATRQGMNTTAHNIANAQTEGYSRQDLKLAQRDPIERGRVLTGTGVVVNSIDRSHDKYLETQLTSARSSTGFSDQKSETLKKVEAIYSPELEASIADEMTSFYDALESLSQYPEDMAARTAVKERGETLAMAFRRVDRNLREHRSNINDQLESVVKQVNDLSLNIADLNIRIHTMETGPANQANDLRDQRDRMVREISNLIDVHYYEDQFGMVTVRGPGEVSLVDRGANMKIGIERSDLKEGLYDIIAYDEINSTSLKITNRVEGGKMGALVDLRDSDLKRLIVNNNELASSFIEQFNNVHRQGYGVGDFSENNNLNFFNPVTDLDFAAKFMTVDNRILNSINAIAASSMPNSEGDNINLNALLALKHERVLGDKTATFHEYYANMVGKFGVDVQRVEHMKDADHILLEDLLGRREALAGVSLDEEAANMIKWQKSFTASSKVITTVDEMLETVLSMKR